MRIHKVNLHPSGYTGARSTIVPCPKGTPANHWVGLKLMIRNLPGNKSVHVESWLDQNADGNWKKMTETVDNGGWLGGASNPDGCHAAPFRYGDDQIITWAGPYVNFRFDNTSSDIKWFSAREIDPMP